ncbi:MAG: hypothetical protein ACT4O3_01595 [Elusimicrobiota bacterium]
MRPNPFFLIATSMVLAAGPAYPAAEKIPVDLYVMSLCPFGVQAENAVLPAMKSLADHAELRLNFIVSEASGGFKALHGQPEVEENTRQLCVGKHFPDKAFDYILERNKLYRNPGAWKDAVLKSGADPRTVEACVQGDEGRALLSENLKAHVDRKAFSSPTIDIAGRPYKGPRTRRSVALAVCAAIAEGGGREPAACGEARSLPEDPAPHAAAPAPDCPSQPGSAPSAAFRQGPIFSPAGPPNVFEVRVVKDDRCPDCETSMVKTLKSRHPGAEIKILKAGSREGKTLLKRHAAEAPLYVLARGVEKEGNFKPLLEAARYIPSHDEYLAVPHPSPRFQARTERVRSPGRLDVFLEAAASSTPDTAAELVSLLTRSQAENLTFSLHFLVKDAPVDGAGFSKRIRRTPQFQESVRQACLFQEAPIAAYFNYLDCRQANAGDPARAKACLAPEGPVQACVESGMGEDLLLKTARLSRELNISEGGHVLWENQYGPFGWQEAGWRALLDGKI